ncbi:MAG: hypothetical protein AB8H86_30660 [Polyangiales bacterium]
MRSMVQDEFESCLAEAGLSPKRLSPSAAALAFAAAEEFAEPGHAALWERTSNALSRRDPEGWRRIADITEGPQVLLFESCGYVFETPAQLGESLAESYGFVFYVTNPDYSYLISFNDHDYLSVAGNDELKRRLVASYQACPGEFDNPDGVSLGSDESGDFVFGFPRDWAGIEEQVLRALQSSTPESRGLQKVLRRARAEGGVDAAVLLTAAHRVVDAHDDVADAAGFVLLFSRFFPLDDCAPEFFGTRPGLWQRCSEIVAKGPLGFNRCNRIFYHDLLYGHYLDSSVERYDKGGIESVVALFEEQEFFRNCDLGREVAGRVRHRLSELRLRKKPHEQARLSDDR